MINEELFDLYVNRRAVIKTCNAEQYNILRDYVNSKGLKTNNLEECISSDEIYNSYGFYGHCGMGYGSTGSCYRHKGYEFIDFEDVFEGGEEDNKFDIFDYLK